MQHSPVFSLCYQLSEDAVGWQSYRMLLILIDIGVLQASSKSNYIVVILYGVKILMRGCPSKFSPNALV